jgi:hypothetical protein
MRPTTLALAAALSLTAAGCFVAPDPEPRPVTPAPSTGPTPTPVPTPTPALDAPAPLGALGMLGYHVRAGASAALPDGDLGYVVTANGAGGYRVIWSDTYGSAAHFSGTITTDGQFDPNQLQHYSGGENIWLSSDLRTLYFDSVPGSVIDGVDLVSSTDPIYLDGTVDGSHGGFSVYFSGADSGQLLRSAYNPVAFTSP